MARMRLQLRYPSLPYIFSRISLLLVLVISLLAIYRYCWTDAQDPFKCEALLNHGHWLEATPQSNAKGTFQHWQPPGCLIHEYTGKDISICLPQRRMLYLGDSTTRQIFWETVRKLDSALVDHDMPLAGKHSDLTYTRRDVTVDFVWDPYLNSTRLTEELVAYRDGKGRRIQVSGEITDQRAAMIVIGGGLWFARHLGMNSLRPFRETIDNLMTLARPVSPITRSAYRTGHFSDYLLLIPVQIPWYQSLEAERKESITPEKIDSMNEYLEELSRLQGSDLARSFTRLVNDHGEAAYGRDGLHVIERVASQKADILLNLRCNGQTAAFPHDRTCCSNYRRPTWPQWLILISGIAILPILCWSMRRSSAWSLKHQLGWKGQVELHRSTLCAMSIFLAPICMCFYADRTQVFNKVHKSYSDFDFLTMCSIALVLGLLSIRRSLPHRPSVGSTRHQQTHADQPFLSRLQTDEWKGWMQFLVLIYHYTSASKVLWIYQVVRLLVASYLFMTGFGHTVFLLKKRDYSLRRVAGVLVRINLLSCVLPYLMRTDYLSYYFAPLVSFWFLVVYLTLRIGRERNDSARFLFGKICVSAVIVRAFYGIPGLLELFFSLLRYIARIDWNVDEWRFRVTLDIFVVYVGMLTAAGFVAVTSPPSAAVRDSPSRTIRTFIHTLHPVVIVLSTITIPLYLIIIFRFPNKFAYNVWHPYISAVPILAFVILRNASRSLRNFHSSIFAWLGRCSLETFTLQFHIWLAGDTRGLLSLGVLNRGDQDGGRGKWLEFVMLTVAFLWLSSCMADATSVLTSWIVDGGAEGSSTRPSRSDHRQSRHGDVLELPRVEHHLLSSSETHESSKTLRDWFSGRLIGMWRHSLGVRLTTILAILWVVNLTYT